MCIAIQTRLSLTPFSHIYQCIVEGTIVTLGTVLYAKNTPDSDKKNFQLPEGIDTPIPIVGGTGKYIGAGGESKVERKGDRFIITLTMV